MELILVVEDLMEEQDKAKAALAALGFKAVVAGTLFDARRLLHRMSGQITGVLTDLHFPERISDRYVDEPCGLTVVAMAVKQGLPVAVCSDIDHHYAFYCSEVIEVLSTHQNYAKIGSIPFSMDRKDWAATAELLVALVTKTKEEKD